MRCALFGPTPGSRPSSSIRSWTAPSYMPAARRSEAGQPRPPGTPPPVTGPIFCSASSSTARLASRTAATTRSCSVSTSSGSTACGSMVQRAQLAAAGQRRGDQPAAGGAGDLGVGELGLRGGELLLHLLRLLHQLLHVRLATAEAAAAALGHRLVLRRSRVSRASGVTGPLGRRPDARRGARVAASASAIRRAPSVDSSSAHRRPPPGRRGAVVAAGSARVGVVAGVAARPRLGARRGPRGGAASSTDDLSSAPPTTWVSASASTAVLLSSAIMLAPAPGWRRLTVIRSPSTPATCALSSSACARRLSA